MGLNDIIGVLTALLIFFLFSGTIFLTFLDNSMSYNSCSATTWVGNSTYASACAEYGSVYNTSDVSCGEDQCCASCTNWGFRTTSRGLITLVFALALVSIAIYFFGIKRY